MQIKIVQDATARFLRDNATTVLTAGGVVGTVATAVLSFRAGMKTERILNDHRFTVTVEEEHELSKTDTVKLVGAQVIPPLAAGGLTIGSVVMAHRISATKAAALAAAYGVSQKQFDEYKTKVTEKLTGAKKEQVQDELAQERVNRTPGANTVFVTGDEVLCFDQPTGRYFKSTMENINRAANATNAEIIQHGFCPASYFYDELEMPPTTWTDDVGFNRDNMVELAISTVMGPNDKPALAIDFVYLPKLDYQRLY